MNIRIVFSRPLPTHSHDRKGLENIKRVQDLLIKQHKIRRHLDFNGVRAVHQLQGLALSHAQWRRAGGGAQLLECVPVCVCVCVCGEVRRRKEGRKEGRKEEGKEEGKKERKKERKERKERKEKKRKEKKRKEKKRKERRKEGAGARKCVYV